MGMKNRNTIIFGILIFCLLMGVYLLTFSGMGVSDDEQLFTVLSGSLAEGRGYSALPLFGNDRIRGGSGNIEPLHPLFGAAIYSLAEAAGLGLAQALHLPAGIYTALSAALLAMIALHRGYPKTSSITLALCFGLSSIALPYARTNFREPLAMLFLTCAAFSLEGSKTEGAPSSRYFLSLMGATLFTGLAALTKLPCALCLPVFWAAAWLALKKDARLTNKAILSLLGLCLLTTAAGLLILSLFLPEFALGRYTLDFFIHITRSLLRLPHGNFWAAMAGMLFSPGKGLFIYSPVLILAILPILKWCLRQAHTVKQIKINSDRLLAFGSLMVLMVIQALIYDEDWWSITWGTRALLPALPLLILTCLPSLNAGLQHTCRGVRVLTWLPVVLVFLIQLGRLLVPDPAYVGWLVETSGQEVSAAHLWDLNLMPLWRHWQLALQGIPSDIAWLHLEGNTQIPPYVWLLGTLFIITAGFEMLSRKENPRALPALLLLGCTLALMPVILITARNDRRYFYSNPNYRQVHEWLGENTQAEDLVLVDAYLKAQWWYFFNFKAADADWIGLPYEHQKPLSGELYYPRLGDLKRLIQGSAAPESRIYLLEALPADPLAYHEELEEYGFEFVPVKEIRSSQKKGVGIYKLTIE
jgi:hypothetical protein